MFNPFPNASFSQNVGLVGLTGVASRFLVAITGLVLIGLGFFPKAAVVAAMPSPVPGGGTIVLFGMISSIGLRIVARGVELNRRTLTIVGVSVLLGVGVEVQSDGIE